MNQRLARGHRQGRKSERPRRQLFEGGTARPFFRPKLLEAEGRWVKVPELVLIHRSITEVFEDINMSNGIKPGENAGKQGGIYREVGPRGGETENYVTVRDHQQFPPTTQPGATWKPVKVTPDSKR